MRIAFLNPSGHLGGAEACLLDMIAVLRQSRPEWKISLVMAESGPLAERATTLGAEIQTLPFPPDLAQLGDSGESSRAALALQMLRTTPAVLRYRKQLRAYLSQLRPEIIHTNGFKMHVLGALAKPPGSALIWHIHDYVSPRALMARLLRRMAKRADAIITNSQSVAEDIRSVVGESTKIAPILNVVDLQEFSPAGRRLDLDSQCGLPPALPSTVRVGLVATMAWWKGHRLFLDALSLLPADTPVRGYIIGGAVYQTSSKQESIEALKEYAAELGISDRVGFTGFVDQPASAMRALDIVVHASTQPEPFGRVIAEAMACGKPMISSGVGGAAEILVMGDFAIAFMLGDAVSLARSITQLANDPSLRVQLGGNGLSTARARFGRERLVSQLPPVYEEVAQLCP